MHLTALNCVAQRNFGALERFRQDLPAWA